MPLNPDFPIDPHVVLDPDIRWYPGDQQELFTEDGYARLLPPLVYSVRQGVKTWRDSGYAGASDTTRALLFHWFKTEHNVEGLSAPFRYFFAQREAVESAIWLYEITRARDPYALIKYDSSGRVSKAMFDEDWTRYVMKLATGAGKTKVMSLLLAWSYFHKRYEADSDLSTNFLVIAPNIIVLDRLRVDFDGLKIFFNDPVLPENGYEGQNWRDDFQPTLHVQDEVGVISDTGNIFLTNIHRVYEGPPAPSFDDANVLDYFGGRRPRGKTNESQVDLGQIVREVPDLVVINDEAHHIHDPRMAWFKSIQDISNQLRQKGSKLSAQLDLTATPKHENGAIFVQTISDYPLVEAIRQQVVKTPVLPDAASRAKLVERASTKFSERYQDYLHLGYLEWEKRSEEVGRLGKKPVLFVMTEDTRNCDEVGEYLEARYPELKGKVLVIHTRNNGEISESASGKSKEELEKLRKESREIDDPENRYKAIVSVMMLREGWDVQNVVAMVGLRPFKSDNKILPEQALGRGLRLMYRGWSGEGGLPIAERVSVIGTDPFMQFVESIRSEGVELEYAPMGNDSRPKSPVVVEVDHENEEKDIETLDVELPVLAPRIQRDYKNLGMLDVAALKKPAIVLKNFSAEQQREIVFKDMDTLDVSHTTVLDSVLSPTHQAAVGFFANTILRDLKLVGGFDVLFGKLKEFMETALFGKPVDLDDLNVLRNLSEPAVTRAVLETFKQAINALTVSDKGTTQVRDSIKLSRIRPFVVNDQPYAVAGNSIFNKVVCDNAFELELAELLSKSKQIISFAKIPERKAGAFSVEYQSSDGGISNYYPDFVVKQTEKEIWLIETKGREDLNDPRKWKRLKQYCADATEKDAGGRKFCALFIPQEQWEKYRPKTFKSLCETFADAEDESEEHTSMPMKRTLNGS
jgi:type III restriction enzyme